MAPGSSDSGKVTMNTAGAPVRVMAVLGGAVVATLLSYIALNSIGTVYPTPPEVLNLGATPTPEERAAASAAKLVVDRANASIWLAAVGAVFGAILPLIACLLRHSGRRTLAGVTGGILLGGGMGFLAGRTAVSTYHRIAPGVAESRYMMMHGLTWAIIGLAIGLACELGNRLLTVRSAAGALAVGGIMGGVAGAMFPFVVAIAAPLLDSSIPVPALGTGMIVFIGVGALMISIGVDQATTSK